MTRDRKDDAAYQALKRATAVVLVVLLTFLVLADVLGRLFVDQGFEVRDTTIGAIIGALVMVLGIRAIRNGGTPPDLGDE